ncbi:hypothetical protein GCM10020331_063870 [Ectobacillus funiculus]
MKKVLGMTTAAIFGLGFFAANADAATVVNTDVLNVRQAPNTDSPILGKSYNRTNTTSKKMMQMIG